MGPRRHYLSWSGPKHPYSWQGSDLGFASRILTSPSKRSSGQATGSIRHAEGLKTTELSTRNVRKWMRRLYSDRSLRNVSVVSLNLRPKCSSTMCPADRPMSCITSSSKLTMTTTETRLILVWESIGTNTDSITSCRP